MKIEITPGELKTILTSLNVCNYDRSTLDDDYKGKFDKDLIRSTRKLTAKLKPLCKNGYYELYPNQ